jgi:hypothetical protein
MLASDPPPPPRHCSKIGPLPKRMTVRSLVYCIVGFEWGCSICISCFRELILKYHENSLVSLVKNVCKFGLALYVPVSCLPVCPVCPYYLHACVLSAWMSCLPLSCWDISNVSVNILPALGLLGCYSLARQMPLCLCFLPAYISCLLV